MPALHRIELDGRVNPPGVRRCVRERQPLDGSPRSRYCHFVTVSGAAPTIEQLRAANAPDLRRDRGAVLQLSRIACTLIWRDGFVATRGEDIAGAAGVSTRTLWRYFRSKEACAEPILESLAAPLLELLERWPLEQTLQQYLAERSRPGRAVFTADQVTGMRIVAMAETEPALRAIWLSICDRYERRLRPVVAQRLRLPDSHADVARIAAAVSAANRALNDVVSLEYTRSGVAPMARDMLNALTRCITEPSGARLGDALSPSEPPTEETSTR